MINKMCTLRFLVFVIFISILGCSQQQSKTLDRPDSVAVKLSGLSATENPNIAGKGALLLTRFNSFEEFKAVVHIEYFEGKARSDSISQKRTMVRVTHQSEGREVTSIIKTGVNEGDFIRARTSGFWTRVSLLINSPYGVLNRHDLRKVYALARRRGAIFGEGDVAFYDIAETMSNNICARDTVAMPSKDLSEKGYINTFNHIAAQAIITSIFSEKLADFIADSHERFHMPELITGDFTEEQIADIDNGPTDNYVDIINNEWGQDLGNILKEKYNVNQEVIWTPELLANYLNDIQSYCSWAFQIGFEPYRPTDELVIRFSNKINSVLKDPPNI